MLTDLEHQLSELHARAGQWEQQHAAAIERVDSAWRASARNLIHYLAIRSGDIRDLQGRLRAIGLSSLGRTESSVLAGLETVLYAVRKLRGGDWSDADANQHYAGFIAGRELLRKHSDAFFGSPPGGRLQRIMVTLPPEAATQPELIRRLLEAGMDWARINGAHDDPDAWRAMQRHVREGSEQLGRPCRILFDLPGPKLRTGPIVPAEPIAKWSPQRDDRGRPIRPAVVWLAPAGHTWDDKPDFYLTVDAGWLRPIRPGDHIHLRDTRGKQRSLKVIAEQGAARLCHGWETSYIEVGTPLIAESAVGVRGGETLLQQVPSSPQVLWLRAGDHLFLHADPKPGRPAVLNDDVCVLEPASISCTLPEVLRDVKVGERVLFDDGRIAGHVTEATAAGLMIEITRTRQNSAKLRADKGINLPDSELALRGLTDTDRECLDVAAEFADAINLSFVNHPDDVLELHRELDRRTSRPVGVMLKIETKAGFRQFPRILLAAMQRPPCSIMIARGDLAVEVGWERLAEVQEEILWLCEAAHVPAVWATQVLENLAQEGVPSRAEITDAAMAQRAECVMLNKGPFIIEAIRTLDDILRRMNEHQDKKTSRLRPLNVAAMEPE